MKHTPIRLGIVGCGRAAATLHLPAFQHVSGIQVVALADPDQQALQHVSTQFSIGKSERDYRALIDDQAIDAIAICTPVQHHVEIAMAAVDAGKHLFIEKPLALTLVDCDRLSERANNSPTKIMIGFNTRWHRLTQRARSLIQQGVVGSPDIVQSVLTSHHQDVPKWRKSRSCGGGVMMEMAIHHFDLWRYLLGQEIVEICALSRSGTWDDESATVSARLGDGTLATATLAERSSQKNEIEVFGQTGSLRLSFYRFDGLEISSTTSIPGDIRARISAISSFTGGLPRAISTLHNGGEWLQSYVNQWRHFAAAIQTGKPVDCGLTDGRHALAISLAAIKSAASGKAVSISSKKD